MVAGSLWKVADSRNAVFVPVMVCLVIVGWWNCSLEVYCPCKASWWVFRARFVGHFVVLQFGACRIMLASG